LAEVGEKEAKARAAKPEDFADTSFVAELDKNGFIDRLYKQSK
jgi:hypothetical protein